MTLGRLGLDLDTYKSCSIGVAMQLYHPETGNVGVLLDLGFWTVSIFWRL